MPDSRGQASLPACDYERARLDRIQRNKRILQELGIEQPALARSGEPKTRARPRLPRDSHANESESAPVPGRRSRRLQGATVEFQQLGDTTILDAKRSTDASGDVHTVRPKAIYRPPTETDKTALDSHNLYRIRSMSHVALQRRIWKIRRVDKLESFIEVLVACEETELAAEAREALASLKG